MAGARGRQAPRSDEFVAFVLDQLHRLDGVAARPMFGGFGLYGRAAMFGIVHRSRLYFRVGDGSRPDYEARGAKPFRPYAGYIMRAYYEVPPEILEDTRALVEWARTAEAVPRGLSAPARRGPRRARPIAKAAGTRPTR